MSQNLQAQGDPNSDNFAHDIFIFIFSHVHFGIVIQG